MILSTKKLIIFDMDGVLLLSEGVHASAYFELCAKHSLKLASYKELAGMRTDLSFIKILKDNGVQNIDSKLVEDLVTEKRALASEKFQKHFPVAPDYQTTIYKLAKTHRFALATSSHRDNANMFLQRTETRHLFTSVISGSDVTKGKPDPEIFLKALEGSKERAENAIVVEDSENGIRASIAAGIDVIGVVGLNTKEELLSYGCIAVITNLNELLNL